MRGQGGMGGTVQGGIVVALLAESSAAEAEEVSVRIGGSVKCAWGTARAWRASGSVSESGDCARGERRARGEERGGERRGERERGEVGRLRVFVQARLLPVKEGRDVSAVVEAVPRRRGLLDAELELKPKLRSSAEGAQRRHRGTQY